MRILITRPEMQAKTFAKQLSDNGFSDFMLEPLLDIHPIQTAQLNFDKLDALIVTSQNAVPSLQGANVPKHLPVFAVGSATAELLKSSGFNHVIAGESNGEALFPLIQSYFKGAKKSFLHPAGLFMKERLQTLLKEAGQRYLAVPVYRADARKMLSEETREALKTGRVQVVTFFSPRSAEIFAKLTVPLSMTCEMITLCSLSAEISEKLAGFGWKSVIIAKEPNAHSMIEAIKTIK